MKSALIFLPLAMAASLVSHDAQAQAKQDFYRWKDAAGVTHYSETPPPKQQAARLSVDGRRPVATTSSAQAAATPPPSQAQAGDGRLATAEAAARQRNCERSQASLQTLGGKAMIVDGTDASVARRLSPEEMAASKRVAQADVDTYCTGAGK